MRISDWSSDVCSSDLELLLGASILEIADDERLFHLLSNVVSPAHSSASKLTRKSCVCSKLLPGPITSGPRPAVRIETRVPPPISPIRPHQPSRTQSMIKPCAG